MYLNNWNQKQFITRDLRHTISSRKTKFVKVGIHFLTAVMKSSLMQFSFSKTPLLNQVSKIEIFFKGVTLLEATSTASTSTASTKDTMFNNTFE